MSALRMFIPITKVDAARRLVYGVATAEAEDRTGEICDYATTKPQYEKWSQAIAKSTRGKSLGNLRAMHGPVAAGKVTAITFNDDDKQIEICAKVVDDAEWAKVEEGVYTGFSQGGAYQRRWTDSDGKARYTAAPSEISLVDLAGAPSASADQARIQRLHDTSVELGASCDTKKNTRGGLEKRFDILAETLAEVLQRLKNIEDQPLPLPFVAPARPISKAEDSGAGDSDGGQFDRLLASPERLSVLAIKLAQRNGRAPVR